MREESLVERSRSSHTSQDERQQIKADGDEDLGFVVFCGPRPCPRVHKKNGPKKKNKGKQSGFLRHILHMCCHSCGSMCGVCEGVCEPTFQCVLISRDREDRCCFGSLQKCERTRAWNGRALACAGIPPSGQRQRREERRQSERLCELTGAVGGDGQTDGRTGCGSCVGGLAVPGCAPRVKGADENYKLSSEIQLGL